MEVTTPAMRTSARWAHRIAGKMGEARPADDRWITRATGPRKQSRPTAE